MINDINTEEKILEAARKVFIEKGFDGARMQEISDSAGINKAMLHYYFRSKDKLFLKIFEAAFKQFTPKIGVVFMSDATFLEKMRLFIDNYLNILLEHPFLPLFIIKEISRNPEVIQNIIINKFDEILNSINESIKIESAKGNIRIVDSRQLILNITSMCIFPFAAKPLMKMLFKADDAEYKRLMIERKEIVFDVINAWLKP